MESVCALVCDEIWGGKRRWSRLTSEFYLLHQDTCFTEIRNIKGGGGSGGDGYILWLH